MEELALFVVQAVGEVVAEIVIKLPGYGVMRLFGRAPVEDPDGCAVLLLGMGFWGVAAACALFIWQITR
ncbi:hypothetical protein Pan44_29820 [Caulifigura coniformis]|uniref:Uncharacterized protein n=1 Tax=Caulifigura coniformis TaxID=2527983 RepID=A0A517SFP0_9PLAN|nr:hypothetical protein [Caulifigura coniformis]QDT54941.1 hypothetical protein Pan44_29820 [Caulifigura coniformis]